MTVGRFGGKGDNARALFQGEINLIRTVFKTARLPPLIEVSIADGVSIKGTPWTDSDYQINVGTWSYDHDLSLFDRSTLVHEMTHVWQYYNKTLTKFHAFFASVRNPEEDLYSYDLNGSWEDMGFEGQAQMVEDWYTMNSASFRKDNPEELKEEGYRYFFMKHVVWSGDKSAAHLTRAQLAMREPDIGTKQAVSLPDRAIAYEQRAGLTDSYLVSLLQPRYAADDVAGFGARARKLEEVFRSARTAEALPLYPRLVARKPGDKVSMYFHDHLSTPTRTKLLQILQNRMAGK
jgi:hypothetical protein